MLHELSKLDQALEAGRFSILTNKQLQKGFYRAYIGFYRAYVGRI